MGANAIRKYAMVALSMMGSAILLFSCGSADAESDGANNETLMTERSEHLTILMSENGRRSYHFTTPLLEGYTLASDPYREFRKGIRITTYQNDSLTTVNATLVANYAIFYEERELWEAKGDVVVEKADGTKLFTQQLFWNSKTGRIYSNVDSKIVKGTDTFMGEGFESDEELKEWRFRRMSGKMLVNTEPTENPDSTATSKSNTATSVALKGDSKSSEDRPESSHKATSKRSENDGVAASKPVPAERSSIRRERGNRATSQQGETLRPASGVANRKIERAAKGERVMMEHSVPDARIEDKLE